MTWSVSDLKGDEVLARDGRIGTLDDVYFDDERWAVRYMVVDTGDWMPGRRMLVSPQAVEAGLSDPGKLRVGATREELKQAPGAQAELPLAERGRMARAQAFGPPYYWSSPALWGAVSPGATPEDEESAARRRVEGGDPHLRSGSEVIGYGAEARDGDAGRIVDFVLDEQAWQVVDVVVDTTKWWPGGRVGVHPEYVDRIDWNARKVFLRLTREQLKAGARLQPRI